MATRQGPRRRHLVGLVVIGAVLSSQFTASAAAAEPPRWVPDPGTTWQYQLQGRIDTTVDADAYDIDLFDVPQRVIDTLHDDGRHVVCYLSAGSWEKWRPDADDFPDEVLGRKLDGWPGERWLDVRRIDLLGPIMEARLDLCAAKGFDAVEPDNVDGYQNRTGFPLTGADQLAYNRWLGAEAHERGLSIGLKNDLGQVRKLEPDFDFAVNEQCFQYDECQRLRPFVEAGKNVIVVEYRTPLDEFCPEVGDLGLVGMRKKLSLREWRQPCP